MLLWILTHIPDIIVHTIVAAGVVGYFFGNLIPMPKLGSLSPQTAGALVFGIGLFLEGLTTGAGVLQSELDAAKQEVARINEQSKQITEKVVVKYVTEQKNVKEKGDQIVKYITTNNDKQCVIYGSTVELLNSAAKNELPDPAAGVNDTPSGVELSTVTKTVVDNYSLYNQIALQLKTLQEWVFMQSENNK